MTFESYSSHGFSCALTRAELEAYHINIDEIGPDAAETLPENMHELLQDVIHRAMDQFHWDASGMLELRARKVHNDQLILEVSKHARNTGEPPAAPPPEKAPEDWKIFEIAEDCEGLALYFKNLSLTAAYLHTTRKAVHDSPWIYLTLYKHRDGYLLDVSCDMTIKAAIKETEKNVLRHIISAATEYADNIITGEEYLLQLCRSYEHAAVIASNPEEFDMIMRFGMPTQSETA